jgi:hypothetical protein
MQNRIVLEILIAPPWAGYGVLVVRAATVKIRISVSGLCSTEDDHVALVLLPLLALTVSCKTE